MPRHDEYGDHLHSCTQHAGATTGAHEHILTAGDIPPGDAFFYEAWKDHPGPVQMNITKGKKVKGTNPFWRILIFFWRLLAAAGLTVTVAR